MSGEQASRFTLVYRDRVRAVLEQLVVRAIQEGQRQWLAQLLRRLQERLELDPLAFGEPLYYLPNARLHIRAGGVPQQWTASVAGLSHLRGRLVWESRLTIIAFISSSPPTRVVHVCHFSMSPRIEKRAARGACGKRFLYYPHD
jgi:hypothetical protein